MTVVGSGWARRPMPNGPEAWARALRLCEYWKANDPSDAMVAAWKKVGFGRRSGGPSGATWLPAELLYTKTEALRALVAGTP